MEANNATRLPTSFVYICPHSVPDAERSAKAVPEVHESVAGDEVGAALAAVDEQEVAVAVAMEKAVEEMVGQVERIGAQRLVPLVVCGDDYVVSPL